MDLTAWLIIVIAILSFFCGSIAFYLLGVNIIAFFLFGYDKFSALKGRSRIPEKFLLTVCLIGGVVGALTGMLFFRHKICKKEFYFRAIGIFLIHFILLLLLIKYA